MRLEVWCPETRLMEWLECDFVGTSRVSLVLRVFQVADCNKRNICEKNGRPDCRIGKVIEGKWK